MNTYVVLLRGINVGGHRKVAMAQLRDVLGNAGFDNVKTYVQSGNIVLKSADDAGTLEAIISQAIRAGFGFDVDVLVYRLDTWRAIVDANPFPHAASDPTKLVVMLMRQSPDPAQMGLLHSEAADGENALWRGGALYLDLPFGQARSKMAELAYRLFRTGATARNWRTMTTLLTMAETLDG
jgi:uncharacterized protein (DUF1697 family)